MSHLCPHGWEGRGCERLVSVAAGNSEGKAMGGNGAGEQSRSLTVHSPCLELPPECTFSVVSLSCGARDSLGSTTHTGAARSCSPCAGDPGVAETLAGTYWHLAMERESFWQGPGLLPGISHETYTIERTLLNKVLAGRRARRLLCLFSPTTPGHHQWEASGFLTEVGAASFPSPSSQSWRGAQGQAEVATEVPGHKQCRSEKRKQRVPK